jgi:8-oxo-dGTP pyrophosphatase MutT (NUDIX family)
VSVSRAPHPAQVPVRSAATIMLVEDRPDLHVLLLRRRAASAFVGGMMVFPGGALDPADADPRAEALCVGLDDATASRRLGLPQGGLAYWVAAIRETFEEAGVLLAVDAASQRELRLDDPAAHRRFDALRADVDQERIGLVDAARDEHLQLRTDAVHYVGRWVTPEGPPRRYDTRFFLAACPAGQRALHDHGEAVDSCWMRPAEALDGFESGSLTMLPPTLGMLRALARFESSAQALEAAARHEDGPDVEAKLAGSGHDWRVLLPGDPDYRDAATLQPRRSWLRLWSADEGSA